MTGGVRAGRSRAFASAEARGCEAPRRGMATIATLKGDTLGYAVCTCVGRRRIAPTFTTTLYTNEHKYFVLKKPYPSALA
eukprot:31468-Pelagococcus_subviridis.AAC.7